MKLMLRLLMCTFLAAMLAACAMEGDEAALDENEPVTEAEAAVEVPTAEEGTDEGARPKGTPCVVAQDGTRLMPLPCPPPPPED